MPSLQAQDKMSHFLLVAITSTCGEHCQCKQESNPMQDRQLAQEQLTGWQPSHSSNAISQASQVLLNGHNLAIRLISLSIASVPKICLGNHILGMCHSFQKAWDLTQRYSQNVNICHSQKGVLLSPQCRAPAKISHLQI